MRKVTFFVLFLFIFLSASAQHPAVKHINSIAFKNLITNSSGTLLDVRTLGEFKNGHLNESGQLNYYALDFKQRLLLLPKDEAVYLYCNTGYRSKKAAEYLVKNGYNEVYNLTHGIMEWNMQNLPIIIELDAQPDLENSMGKDEFNALINSEKLVFIDFYAPWCAPCRKMMPMIDSLKVTYKNKVDVVKINADASKRLMKELGLVSVPYLVLYHKGNLLFSHNGLISQQELIAEFEKGSKKKSDKQKNTKNKI